MKNHIITLFFLSFITVFFHNCGVEQPIDITSEYDFAKHEVPKETLNSLDKGSTYLSVYSQIYNNTEKGTHSLTVTVSIRNTSITESIYISKADYFDTHGALIASYLKNPIEVLPLETIEIIIDKSHSLGGTGGNFIFDWAKDSATSTPIFEGVMISTSAQQGISFTTQGVNL